MGKAVVCPVLGTKFNVSNVTQASDYKGKTYYFCCAECPGEFKKNPDKYAK
ncbi:MAG TPA: YHS domain-containing protein [Elusimicrobia bacterium]|nr:YHS domain-containing protein [Elusimicrobiota bacterium]